MNPVIIFDISDSSKLGDIKNGLKNKGYYDAWGSDAKIWKLPNNCMWKPNIELKVAYADIDQAIKEYNAWHPGTTPLTLTQVVILNSTPWYMLGSG